MPRTPSWQGSLACTSWMVCLVFSYPYTPHTLPDIKNETFIKDCVHAHNKFRSEVSPSASNMRYMTWDPELAQIAKRWAENCQFKHNPRLGQNLHKNFTPLGENIWTGTVSIFSVSSAIKSWYNEVRFYDYYTRRCSEVCGHYTQVVWADSFKVGCAVHYCSRVGYLERIPNAAHFICDYGPAGNYPTQPYKKGSACSACDKNDICLDNLCANPKRDEVPRYYSVNFPDRPLHPRNRYTSLFLIINPPIIILSVIIAIFVKHKYPHLTLKG